MALDVSPQNSSAAVPAVQSDPKAKRGNLHQRRRQGRRERRQGQKSSPPRKVVIYRTIRMGLGPDASNARITVPAVQSDRRSKRGAPNQRQRRGGDKTKSRRHQENREIFYDSHGSWYWHSQLECRGFSRVVRSKFQERRLAGTETPPKVPRSHFNWRSVFLHLCGRQWAECSVPRGTVYGKVIASGTAVCCVQCTNCEALR